MSVRELDMADFGVPAAFARIFHARLFRIANHRGDRLFVRVEDRRHMAAFYLSLPGKHADPIVEAAAVIALPPKAIAHPAGREALSAVLAARNYNIHPVYPEACRHGAKLEALCLQQEPGPTIDCCDA